MKKNEKKYALMMDCIKKGQISKVKNLVEQGIDIHYYDDYFLYLAAFAKNEELQKYFIDIGLDPEVTKGRLAIAHPEDLEYLRGYKREKEIREYTEELTESLLNKNSAKSKIKI